MGGHAVAVEVLLLVVGLMLAAVLTTAVALGAMVAPPGPVAVEAVAGPVRMPRRLLSVQQSEGLFNDATALVVFQTAVLATVQGSELSGSGLVLRFVLGALAAVALGILFARAARWIIDRVADPKLPEEAVNALHERMSRLEALLRGDPPTAEERDRFEALRRGRRLVLEVQADALAAAREEVLAARREPGVDPEAADRVLHRLDLRTVLLD